MEVYRAPEVLIIHLKRFSHSRSMMGARKVSELVDFPINGLNMAPFLIDKKQKKVIYDLYAVSNHFGGMGGGHYTAYAKNFVHEKWYNFDDSDVSKASSSDCISKAAYVLFYKLRK